MQLIQTKLFRPQINASLIQRPHLLARLNKGLGDQLILIAAPPGFGKTTLAGQWLDGCEKPFAWISLDESDNHLPLFLSYICAGIRRTLPAALSTLEALLTTAQLPDVSYLGDLLLEELNGLPDQLILVLDDYHHIHSSDVHSVLRHLLRYLPPRLHLMIVTRTDPPLPLGRMRIEQRLTEIRAADLRFDLAETRRIFQDRTNHQLDEETINSLQDRTDGWVIGLQVARIALQNQTPAQFLARFGGSNRLLAGYLVEEVMAGLPQDVTEFLTRTALVDRFCAPLGDALMARSNWPAISHTMIEQLRAQNLFIIPLDEEGAWYRYHDLFRDFLLHRLRSEQGGSGLADLHQSASAWLSQAGLIEDALRHALAAGNEMAAATLIETNLYSVLNQQVPAPILTRWLAMFSEDAIQAHAGLLIAQIFLFSFRWDLAAIATSIDYAIALAQGDETIDDVHRRQRLAVLDILCAFLLYHQGDSRRAIPLFRRGLDVLGDPVAHAFIHAQTIHLLVQALAECGQREVALSLLQPAEAEAIAHRRPAAVILLGSRSLLYLHAGELTDAQRVAEDILAHQNLAAAGTLEVYHGWAHYLLGLVCYERNELDTAMQHWKVVESMRYRLNPGAYQAGLIGLALAAQARREPAQALAYAHAAREHAIESSSPSFMVFATALEARLELAGGMLADALRRVAQIDARPNQSNTIWPEQPRLTVLRVLLAQATATSLQAALRQAESCLSQADEAHNTRHVIPLLGLQALVWRALDETSRALDTLDRALSLGEPNRFVRTFLDLGEPMADLLRQFQRRRGSSAYVKQLLAGFAAEQATTGHRALTAHYVRLHGITPLTQRELEVLALIAQRFTVKEIADQLVISPNTVKRHVNNIYSKLGVSDRRQAVAKARDVGLLPPT